MKKGPFYPPPQSQQAGYFFKKINNKNPIKFSRIIAQKNQKNRKSSLHYTVYLFYFFKTLGKRQKRLEADFFAE